MMRMMTMKILHGHHPHNHHLKSPLNFQRLNRRVVPICIKLAKEAETIDLRQSCWEFHVQQTLAHLHLHLTPLSLNVLVGNVKGAGGWVGWQLCKNFQKFPGNTRFSFEEEPLGENFFVMRNPLNHSQVYLSMFFQSYSSYSLFLGGGGWINKKILI